MAMDQAGGGGREAPGLLEEHRQHGDDGQLGAEIGEIGDVERGHRLEGIAVGGRHALNLDEAGLLISDSNPRLVLDPRPHVHGGVAYGPGNPRLLAAGARNDSIDPRLQR
jgi:hypothetical protein